MVTTRLTSHRPWTTLRLPPRGDYPTTRGPGPAPLEALPYRKDDITYRPEYVRLAEAGYVMCRVDGGTGSSEGIAPHEYPLVERSDVATVIEWLATRTGPRATRDVRHQRQHG